MIAIVIYGIIAIALAAVAGYSIISFFDASTTMSRASENLSRMDMVTSLIKANIRYIDGEPMVPMGSDGASYTVLPTWLGAHDTSTSGNKYIYCPFASVSSSSSSNGSGTVDDGNGSNSYAVGTVYNSQTGGDPDKTYVSSSTQAYIDDTDLQNAGILAILLSPLDNNSTMPTCKSVELSNGNFIVDNGIVRVIQKGTVSSQRNLLAASKAVFYVDNVTSGDADGRDANNATTLDAALTFMAVHAPRVMEIRMASGTYNVTVDTFADGIHSLGESKLLLIGDNGGTASNVHINASGGVFSVPVNLHLKDISIDDDIKIPTGRKLFIDGEVEVESIILLGADMYLNNGGVELSITGINGDGGISVLSGSSLTSFGESSSDKNIIDFGGGGSAAIFSKGDVNLVYTDINFSSTSSVGIDLSYGAVLNMDDVDFGSSYQPTTGIYDDGGALSVSGSATTDIRASGLCWDGGLFEYSAGGVGDDSAPDDIGDPNWDDDDATVDEEDYVAIQVKKATNKSDWDCN